MKRRSAAACVCVLALAAGARDACAGERFIAKDPGVRVAANAGSALAGISRSQLELFNLGKVAFLEAELQPTAWAPG